MKNASYMLPYYEGRLFKELEQMNTIKEIQDHLQQYIDKTIKVNNIEFTQELFSMLDKINPTLENQFNYYIDRINKDIHYFNYFSGNSINDIKEREYINRLIKSRIHMLKMRLRYIMHCQAWIECKKKIAI